MSTATTFGYKIGYARVSTLEQDEALQRDAECDHLNWPRLAV
jgi:hypothetical protein